MAFNASTSYSAGEYCTYNGSLYRFIAAHTGAWNNSHVVAVTVGNEINTTTVKTNLAQNLSDDQKARARNNIDAASAGIAGNFAVAFNTSTTYSAGEYCTYNGSLYRFIAAHTGSWKSEHVVAVTVGNEINTTTVKTNLAQNLSDDQKARARNNIDAASAGIAGNFAVAFNTSTTYNAGEYCTYNGSLYRFIAEHTGSWKSEHVVAVTVGNEINTTTVKTNLAQNLSDDQKIRARNNIGAASAGIAGNFAVAFDTSTTYNAGEYCTYNGSLYRFTTMHTGSWKSEHVTAVTVGNEINTTTVKTNLSQNLTNDQKTRARNNIGAASQADLDAVENEALTADAVLDEKVQDLNLVMATKIDDLYESDGYLYGMSNGEVVVGPIGPFAGGGGGGGGGNNAVISITNTTGWINKTVAKGDTCFASFTWSSIEDNIPTGNGSLRVSVSNSVKMTKEVAQGSVTVDVSPYLAVGGNNVAISVFDIYGNSRTIRLNVTVVELSLSSSFDATSPYAGSISFPYTPTGNVSKSVYFILDNVQIGKVETSVSGRQLTFPIEAQTHGAHALRVYFEADINGETVRSNELYYELICIEPLNNTPIITSSFRSTSAPQYGTLNIDYIVYNPSSLTTTIDVRVNGSSTGSLTVDRTTQTFAYRPLEAGTLTIQISTGTQGQGDYASKTWTLTIDETDIDVEAETDSLALYLTSEGRSNTEAHRDTWSYNNISASMTSFNWTSDGWQLDEDGVTVLRVAGDARVTIPYQIFAQDFRGTGKTIEFEFATRTVMNYDSTILSCLSDGRGLKMTAQNVSLSSEQSNISTQFKDNEHVRVAFVVEKRSENRLMYCYINGIVSGVVQYPDDDDFSQATPVGISIGSNDCTIDLYCIRIYDNDLTRYQMLNNWIADTQNIEDLIDRYTHNNVYNEYGAIIIDNLPDDLPYLVLQAGELPQYKGDKKTISGYYVDPVQPRRSFTFTGAQFDVQGTSSQYYARKNYKGKFKNGFVMNDGTTASKYQLMDGDIPVNVFCFKADVASSEGANNVELARLYNSACPYKTPAQIEDARVKQGIDGFPIVIFWDNGQTVEFIGKYNFNIDKSAESYFGFVEGDESWEVKNNTSDRVLWKSANYTGTDWQNDFEARYPDTDPPYLNPAQLKEFAEWIVTTDQSAATGDSLPESVTYETGEYDEQGQPITVTYTNDTAAYRLAKFRAEIGNYVEMDSMLFYYLFTELFLMVDSRAKNMFPSFMGSVINAGGGDE